MNENSVEKMFHKFQANAENLTENNFQDNPFFVINLSDVEYKYSLWKLKMPRIHPYYAVKCNAHHVFLQFLADLGVNFDCASKFEIKCILDLGVDPSRIIIANPCKDISDIKYAESFGIKKLVFDNEEELRKIRSGFPNAKLLIRIKVDDSGAPIKFSGKFGCDLERVPHLLNIAKELGLNIIGVTFHVGSNTRRPSVYTISIASARRVFDVAKEMGWNFTVLDIGGGFPGLSNSVFEECVKEINSSLEENFPEGCGVQIIAEPGRYIAASAFTLYTRIIAKSNISTFKESGKDKIMYYLNDGVYGSFHMAIYKEIEHCLPKPMRQKEGSLLPTTLWGPTCAEMDYITDAHLPDMEVGEWLVFENMGAYSLALSTTFNGIPKAEVRFIYLDSESSNSQIRERRYLGKEIFNYAKESFPAFYPFPPGKWIAIDK